MTASIWIPSRLQWIAVAFLMLVALALRLETITSPPLEFEPTRQYKSYIITRGFYFGGEEDIPAWQREVADLNLASEERLEPPIMEAIMALVFDLVGQEVIWLPRLVSAIFWLVGGVFLYLIAKDLSSAEGAIFALAFYLFLPFGIPASRAFQPEPLMVMTLIISIYAILRYDRQPTTANLLFAASITAFAIIIKGVSAFPIGSMYGFLLLAKYGLRQSVTSPRVWMFTLLSLLPAVLYYGYQFFLADSLRGHLDKSFIPALYIERDFWFGWLDILNLIFGFPILIAALVGILLLRDVVTKSVAFGLWVGYVVYGLITTRHIATHDYYSVPLIPIVALSLAPLAGLVVASLSNLLVYRVWRLAALGIILLALALNIYSTRAQIVRNLGEDYAASAEAIGELVDHSTNIVYLSNYHGLPLKYHGDVVGTPWASPPALGITDENANLSAEARLDRIIAERSPEYFVITDMQAYARQPELHELLLSRFELMAETPDYLVFDLSD